MKFLLKYYNKLTNGRVSNKKGKRSAEYQELQILKKRKHSSFIVTEIAEEATEVMDIDKSTSEFSDMSLDKVKFIATLGKGGFARVDLVHLIDKPSITFALKRVKKEYVVSVRQQQNLMNERNIQLSCESDFICRMYKTFRDDRYVYMLLEACLGGEVWRLLRERGKFDEHTAKFIIACVAQAFDYLHPKGIVYRDLKPENLVFDSRGYVKLVDFGFAKTVGSGNKTGSFCGTVEYLAPELIRRQGHDTAVDYWALGILTHELLTGDVPFNSNSARVAYLILKGFENYSLANLTCLPRMFIKQLCEIDPTLRLCCQGEGVEAIRSHMWFSSFNWKELVHGNLPSPITICLKNNHDTSYFDKHEEVEEEYAPTESCGWGWDANF